MRQVLSGSRALLVAGGMECDGEEGRRLSYTCRMFTYRSCGFEAETDL